MIHVVTAANRSRYTDQIEEMHRLRWGYYIEQRKWRDLEAIQSERGYEKDAYDDERAIYLLALSPAGEVQGSMRLRPMDDKSLLLDRFPDLVTAETAFEANANVWEITRLMRSPEFRGADGELRLKINCAAAELGLTRGVRRFVAVMDTFLLPATRALMRTKHRVLGLPQEYAEGEMIAVEYCADAEWLAGVRKVAGFKCPMMFEAPPPTDAYALAPMQEAYIVEATRTLPPDRTAALVDWLAANGSHKSAVAA